MKYFNVLVLSKGKKNSFLIRSDSKKEAIEKAKLKTNGVVLKIEETSQPLEEKVEEFKNYLLSFRKIKIKRTNLIATMRQLAVMANAGIPLHDALNEIANSTNDKQLQIILKDIAESINAGIGLSQSMEKYKDELGNLTIMMIKLGEQTGDMASALFTLTNILEKIDENVRKFKKAIRYPLITLGAMAIAFTILIVYVVPKFKEIFERFHAKLPLPTRILLNIEYIFTHYGLYILLFLIASTIFVIFLYRTNPQFKKSIDTFLLKLYLLKDIIYYAQLNRFMLVFSELVKAGIPVIDALENSISLVDNSYLQEKLEIVKTMVEKGSSIEEAFAQTGLFENMILQMIAAGEASGQLDNMLQKITEYYGMKFDYILDNLSSYIEPIMLVIIAAMVLLLALGIFLPMWDMAQVVQGRG
ncbi:general secretion pathway protein F [Nitratiruptor sp. YY08-26]|uniref:type II secretion system F family protein n=1 Tax=unclassified Nitratiruptor TaxID=2624044 RepID=UPI001915C0E0|nr:MULTISPECIES: type II secretion system F family protein [unclassified Nitratiruptor]BCD62210.1 general secretion pathway protein F [Nitratiruptor sp. YY08-13]BCD66146.1 general secretion pathway protein F [Nitratiruptor sp. YY08-26]